ncbi:MAG: glycosyltransferase [Anaerolineaceae bacterium]|nr:glycosyltransferase [Anaerolineaceae bacterium]
MKIAYVAIHLEKKYLQSGVGRKIFSHIAFWRKEGHQVEFFLHSPDDDVYPNTHLFRYSSKISLPVIGRFFLEVSRSYQLWRLIRRIKEYQPDIIYLRFGLFTIPLGGLFKVSKVILEVNSNDIDEYKSRGWFFYYWNKWTRQLIFKPASGFVTMSNELSEMKQNSKFSKPSVIIPNSINLDLFPFFPAPKSDKLRVVFVGIPGQSWQGTDKLVVLAKAFPELIIDLIGFLPEDLGIPIPNNMVFHGLVSLSEVQNIMKSADTAFGTLALHRKNMQETSSLKTGEALALGIPLIMANDEPAFINHDSEFILKIPNEEKNISFYKDEIFSFIKNMKGKRVPRNEVEPLISQVVWEKKKLAFMTLLKKGYKG